MRLRSSRHAVYLLSWLSLVVFRPGLATAVSIDRDGNGISDIWELLYGAAGVDPNDDTDGDGVPNVLEAIAGTDPFDSNSVPKISFSQVTGTNFAVTIQSALGKRYALESAQPNGIADWTNWTTQASVVARSASTTTLTAPAGDSVRFFRISVSDVDSDGDGVNDWEEYQLGLDPMDPSSNGQRDANGQLLNDYQYAIGKLEVQNAITITATDPTANQPDPGQTAENIGLLTVTRGGFALNGLLVNLGMAGSGPGVAVEGIDHAPVYRSVFFPAGSTSQTVEVIPLANTNRLTPAIATVDILAGTGYQVGSASNASVVIYPAATPSGTGLLGQYFTNSSATYSSSANFNSTNLVLTQTDPTIDFIWGSTNAPFSNSGYYTVRWTGQVQPQYSELYYFVANSDDGIRLWVNDQLIIDSWVRRGATDSIGTIPLQGGLRYDLKIEYFNSGGSAVAHLSWYSASQPKQIIPSNRLYPSPAAPAAITSALSAVGFLGQPFSFTVTAANSASAFTASGLPPGLIFNPTNGVISGIPNVAGDFQVSLTASNSVGLGASLVQIRVFDTGSSVVSEVWTGVAGTQISDIPVALPPTSTTALGTLEGITDYGDNYGERIRGFFIAPVTGNYYFWIAGSDSAELWISNDNEPVNKVRRAYVLPTSNTNAPPANGTGSRQWNLQPNQQSQWLALAAGQPYYLEILHKAGVGSGDNWSVGWLQDPTGTNLTAAGIVPSYLLSRYYPTPISQAPGILYAANMLAVPGVPSTAVGSATLRLSADGSQAVLKFQANNLSSPITDAHIDSDPYLSSPNQLIFDISAALPEPDGSYIWTISPAGTLTAADILEVIREGKASINIQSGLYPGGEIAGHFTLADGTQTFTSPPLPSSWVDDHANPDAAARFLIQATFGPSLSDVAVVQSVGYSGWIDNQFSLPPTHHLPTVLANVSASPTTPYPSSLTFNTWWQQSATAPDQLRQRVAFALSEILVISENGVLQDNARALSSYYDILLDNAFGNYRQLLEAVTLSPAMGIFLDMRANDKGNIVTGIHANENYAREIMQLFSIGLNRMWPDGTLVMDSQGNLVPTYDQNVIMGFASVFTGWNYYQTNRANGRLPTNFNPPSNYTNPMVLVPSHHDLGTKLLLDNVMLPQAWGSQADPNSANFDAYGLQDLESALDCIFNNQNVGPFICRQLIQRLVTSNPSRDYLYRVVQKFNDNGAGVRGDMQAVIKAVLLDYEARSPALLNEPTFGKQREPLLRATATARAFPGPAPVAGTYAQNGDPSIAITTASSHRLNTSDIVWLIFSDTSGQPAPYSQGYRITVTNPTTFTITAPGISTGTYSQTSNTITVTIGSHGVSPGNSVYLSFTGGGAANGVYQVSATNSASSFNVTAMDSVTRTGTCILPKLAAAGYTQRSTNITVAFPGPHGLNPGDSAYINFTSGSATDGVYQVFAVTDATHFTVITTNGPSQTQNSATVFPLVPPPLTRSGIVIVQTSTWHMNDTDSSLSQTPLSSPTVFNFFFPDYKFPGVLASAGLTTPEFQLTSDTTVAVQMNFLEGGLLNNGSNTNGITSFIGGNGAIALDLGPWMTAAYTSNAGLANLVDALSSLLTGGELSASARNMIVDYVSTSFAYGSPPTNTQMRDRVRAVAHLIVTSPDFTIQR
ncbi:MAG TPA: DUF1800 family protein [Candidatus Limnocylindrales bacterium]|nr:DUF1800 family protein [Candidatus Limnocylindrales bacterium]